MHDAGTRSRRHHVSPRREMVVEFIVSLAEMDSLIAALQEIASMPLAEPFDAAGRMQQTARDVLTVHGIDIPEVPA